MINWTHIMVHHSLTKDGETVNWKAIRHYHVFEKKWRDIGYQFGIENVGHAHDEFEVLVGRPLNMTGAHCYQKDMNKKAIGICCVGNFDETKPSGKMLTILSHRIIIPLMDIFNIPTTNIVFHREYAPKTCPGVLFKKQDLIEIINGLR